ncbi:MAG: hypothetical protein ABSF95_23335 [Verrucomicrobiota bacterium]|jgi:hypothetical protein
MPIRLNLLAEAQAAEEMRRRDPVKRALVVAVVFISLMLMWSSSLQLKVMLAKSSLNRVEGQIGARTNQYRNVLDNEKKIKEIKDRLGALQHLAANRFLNANLLNALQHAMVDDVQLLHLRLEQTYAAIEPPKPPSGQDHGARATVPAVTERIVLTLGARDSSPNPGDQINKFKEVVACHPYFREMLDKTNAITLKNFSLPLVAAATGKPCVLFSLECRYQEKTR